MYIESRKTNKLIYSMEYSTAKICKLLPEAKFKGKTYYTLQ